MGVSITNAGFDISANSALVKVDVSLTWARAALVVIHVASWAFKVYRNRTTKQPVKQPVAAPTVEEPVDATVVSLEERLEQMCANSW